jgi:Alginate export
LASVSARFADTTGIPCAACLRRDIGAFGEVLMTCIVRPVALAVAVASLGLAGQTRAGDQFAIDREPPLASLVAPAAAATVNGQPASSNGTIVVGQPPGFASDPPAPRPQPRLGLFPLPPSGPGYYSGQDWLTGTLRDGPAKYPFRPFAFSTLSFFDADWRYVDEPGYEPDLLEQLKRMRPNDDLLIGTGGQLWARYANEQNARLTRIDNAANFTRVRAYVDVWYQGWFRVFAEGYYADRSGGNIAPLATDIDKGDFQNLFVEARVVELNGSPVSVRAGRQEIALGSQRLVATPDWGVVRRSFQGVRAMWGNEQWDADLFWVKPVIPKPNGFNDVDNNVNFGGAFVTYRPRKGSSIDAYYLALDNSTRLVEQGIIRSPSTIHTIGGRYAGDIDEAFLWETEAAIQVGRQGKANVLAGMFTGGLGYHFKGVPWNPTFWAVYNYASGDDLPNQGTAHTFHQLFPFTQYYEGWIDAVGHQNQHDLNLRLYLYPEAWITVWLQYHHYELAAARDALYGIAGQAYRRDATGRAGTNVGDKAEVIANFHLTKRADVYCGYSYLWGGDFLKNTAGPRAATNSSIAYVGYSYRW